jgi:hypothetical protein
MSAKIRANFKVHTAPVGTPWMRSLAFGHHEGRTPTHGYEPTREARWRLSPRVAGLSGAGQAEQATRQRWPPPAPRLRPLLRGHPAGWQSGRGGLSTGATVGRGDRGEAATTAISIARASASWAVAASMKAFAKSWRRES